MRIGMMADLYKPHVSGVTNYIALNKHYLESEGHEVYVFTFGNEDYQDDEPNVIRSPGLPISDTGMYFNLRYTREARRMLRTMDVAHVHHPFISGSIALRYCKANRTPIVFTNHTRYDLYAKAYLPILLDSFGIAAVKAYMPTFCRSCDLVISPSQGMRLILEDIGVNVPIDVIPNGVDITPFIESTAILDRKDFGFKSEDVILVYTGRLSPEKNLSFLLHAIRDVARVYENIGVLIIGDGREFERMNNMVKYLEIENHVYFTGIVSYDELPSYLAISDIFVTASVSETFCLSVVEAMAAGLPAIGIRSPGIGDIIIDGETGFLVNEDITEFADKLKSLVLDKNQINDMGVMAQKVAKLYDIRRINRTMLEHYHRLVQQL